jgi:hypothetical protein
VIDKVRKGLGLVVTAPSGTVTASQRDELVWFGDPDQSPAARHYYLVAVDADTAAANPDPALDPYAIAGPGGIPLWQLQRFLRRTLPLPDDPVRWLTEQHTRLDVGGQWAFGAHAPERGDDDREQRQQRESDDDHDRYRYVHGLSPSPLPADRIRLPLRDSGTRQKRGLIVQWSFGTVPAVDRQ